MTVRSAAECRDAFKYLLEGEVELLQELARSLPQGAHIINIGAGAGTSGMAFMEAREDLHVTTIDLRREASALGSLESEELVFKEAGYWGQARHRQIHGDSKQAGREWAGGPVDLIFIDGDHSYEGCRGDIEVWAPHVRRGGLVVLHDYANAPWGDVQGAVHDTLEASLDFVFERLVSITIAFRKVGP